MSKRIPIFISLLFVAFALWLLVTPTPLMKLLIDQLEQVAYDVQLKTYVLTGHHATPKNIAIIDIDDKSIQAEGRWPWPRATLAHLVDELNNLGATVIAFDIFFSENQKNIADEVINKLKKENKLSQLVLNELKKSSMYFNEDRIFSEAIGKNDTILAIGFLPRDQTQNLLPKPTLILSKKEMDDLGIFKANGFISNIPVLMNAAKNGGFINIIPDNDGVIRYAPLVFSYQNNLYASLALQAVMSYLGNTITLVTPAYNTKIKLEGVKLGTTLIPTDESGQVLIPFIGQSYTFKYFSATDVLNKKIPNDSLLGKIVFIGTSATGLGDLQATSIQNPFPGVEIQATIANGILEKDFSYKPAWALGANIIITLLAGILAAFTFPYVGPRTHGLIICMLPIGALIFNNWLWQTTGLVLSLLVPLALLILLAIFNIIYGYLFETRKREQIKNMFGQYVPEKHIDEMLKSGTNNYALKGEDREMAVLFADIRSFTTISEKLSAAELVELLNTYFTPMTEIIFKHKGTIDKYVGDMIMAFWGAPLKDKNHAYHAMVSALEMQEKAYEMKDLLKERGWPQIKIGIGVNAGNMSVGDMGSKYRRNYTVLGDNVNLGSRVESITKYYGVDIAVTEYALSHKDKFVFRKLDRVQVKGKETGLDIYELICKKNKLTKALEEELAKYHDALADYFNQAWDKALNVMKALHADYPDKKIYQLYIDRITEYKKNPPPNDWDGVFVHTSK